MGERRDTTTSAIPQRKEPDRPRKKNDILLKGAVEEYFPYVLRLLYHDADKIFDMEKGFKWMNKELHEYPQRHSQERDCFGPRPRNDELTGN